MYKFINDFRYQSVNILQHIPINSEESKTLDNRIFTYPQNSHQDIWVWFNLYEANNESTDTQSQYELNFTVNIFGNLDKISPFAEAISSQYKANLFAIADYNVLSLNIKKIRWEPSPDITNRYKTILEYQALISELVV